ncbi:MAG TPA: hypothetical protein VG294_05725 [Solirubrobacteraceae bacterium]|jgi:hypothetical protein|nr:hypothetical protein [Solirubrobacteraceae bacterium]
MGDRLGVPLLPSMGFRPIDGYITGPGDGALAQGLSEKGEHLHN